MSAPARSGPAHLRPRGTEDTISAHRAAPAHLASGRGGEDDGVDPTVSPLASVGAAAVAAAVAIAPAIDPDDGESSGRHLEVVPPRHRSPVDQRKRTRLLLGLSAVAAAFVVFGLVYLHVISTEEQFRIDKLAAKETQQEQTYQDLRLQANRAASPASIYNQATNKLHMVDPTRVQAVPAPRGSVTPASSDLTPKNGATAPGGASDWPAVEGETGGGS
jgi:cell division protein FtsL